MVQSRGGVSVSWLSLSTCLTKRQVCWSSFRLASHQSLRWHVWHGWWLAVDMSIDVEGMESMEGVQDWNKMEWLDANTKGTRFTALTIDTGITVCMSLFCTDWRQLGCGKGDWEVGFRGLCVNINNFGSRLISCYTTGDEVFDVPADPVSCFGCCLLSGLLAIQKVIVCSDLSVGCMSVVVTREMLRSHDIRLADSPRTV